GRYFTSASAWSAFCFAASAPAFARSPVANRSFRVRSFGRRAPTSTMPSPTTTPYDARPAFSNDIHRTGQMPRSVEHDDTARDLAGPECRKCVVDVFQLDAPRDHVVEVQLALQIEIDEPRHV